MCMRKVLLYGSATWLVVTEYVQQLITVDSGMIRWICDVSLKDCIPRTDLPLSLRLNSINDMMRWNRLRFHGHLIHMDDNLKRLPSITLMTDNQEVDHVRGMLSDPCRYEVVKGE